jgi:hypothetical protein
MHGHRPVTIIQKSFMIVDQFLWQSMIDEVYIITGTPGVWHDRWIFTTKGHSGSLELWTTKVGHGIKNHKQIQ